MAHSFFVPLCIVPPCAVLASLPACGGDASGVDPDPPGVDAPVALPGSREPAVLRSLELRFTDRSNETALIGCGYNVGFTVYYRSRSLTTRYCEHTEQSNISSDSQSLLDTDMERIQSAYDQLRSVDSTQCESSRQGLRLDVRSEKPLEYRRLFDAEHSGCPGAQSEGRIAVEGLGELYRVLAEL